MSEHGRFKSEELKSNDKTTGHPVCYRVGVVKTIVIVQLLFTLTKV